MPIDVLGIDVLGIDEDERVVETDGTAVGVVVEL